MCYVANVVSVVNTCYLYLHPPQVICNHYVIFGSFTCYLYRHVISFSFMLWVIPPVIFICNSLVLSTTHTIAMNPHVIYHSRELCYYFVLSWTMWYVVPACYQPLSVIFEYLHNYFLYLSCNRLVNSKRNKVNRCWILPYLTASSTWYLEPPRDN